MNEEFKAIAESEERAKKTREALGYKPYKPMGFNGAKEYEPLTLNASIEIFDILMTKASRDLSHEEYELFFGHILKQYEETYKELNPYPTWILN